MDFDFSSLESAIREILTAPDVDPKSIGAKRVRKALVARDNSLTKEFIKENEEEVNEVIQRVFGEVYGSQDEDDEEEEEQEQAEEPEEETKPAEKVKSKKRKAPPQKNDVDDDGVSAESSKSPPAVKKPKKSRKLSSDAELARKLSSEINGRSSRRQTTKSKPKAKATSRARKSAATVDSGDESEQSSKPKEARGGFAKEYVLSAPLSAVVQVEKLSRPQVVKQLWAYIKGRELQNPSNKREIICDTMLKAVFNVEKIDMFKMNQVLGQHLHEPEVDG